MFQADIDDIGKTSHTVKSMSETTSKMSQGLTSQNGALAQANSGLGTQAESGSILMLRATLDACADGMQTYSKTLSDAAGELSGSITKKRATLLNEISGTVKNKRQISCDESADVADPCTTAGNTASTLADTAKNAKNAAAGLDNGNGEAKDISDTLDKLRKSAGNQKNTIDDIASAWNSYTSSIDDFEKTFSTKLGIPLLDEHAQKAPAADKSISVEYGARITGKLTSFVGELAKDVDEHQTMKKDGRKSFKTFGEKFSEDLYNKLANSFETHVAPWDYFKRHTPQGQGEHYKRVDNPKHSSKEPSAFEKDIEGVKKSFQDAKKSFQESKKLAAVGKDLIGVGKAVGIAGKVLGRGLAIYDVYDVYKTGKQALDSSHGNWESALKAGGKRAVKDIAVTVATDVGAAAGDAAGPVGGLVGGTVAGDFVGNLQVFKGW